MVSLLVCQTWKLFLACSLSVCRISGQRCPYIWLYIVSTPFVRNNELSVQRSIGRVRYLLKNFPSLLGMDYLSVSIVLSMVRWIETMSTVRICLQYLWMVLIVNLGIEQLTEHNYKPLGMMPISSLETVYTYQAMLSLRVPENTNQDFDIQAISTWQELRELNVSMLGLLR